jgi:hypothetical protein
MRSLVVIKLNAIVQECIGRHKVVFNFTDGFLNFSDESAQMILFAIFLSHMLWHGNGQTHNDSIKSL